MKIDQIYISKTLEAAFGENFRKKWNLSKYDNPNLPSVFLGLYTQDDFETILNHKAKFVLIWGGGDIRDYSLNIVKKLIDSNRGYTCAFPGHFSNVLSDFKIPHRQFYIEIKDYSEFQPVPLGDKIYVYRGWKGNREAYFKWKETVSPLIESFGEDRIIFTHNTDITNLRENFYTNCFVYVKPTPKGGCTTMFELGYMGRKTIGAGEFNLPNFIEYKNSKSLIQLIEKEEKKIGKLDLETPFDLKSKFIDSRWLDLKFWKNHE
jgi:hypothetical protein